MPDLERFKEELTALINSCSLESISHTPDFVLANYLVECLHNYQASVARRDQWYGYAPSAGLAIPPGTASTGAAAAPTLRLDTAGRFTIHRGVYSLSVRRTTDGDFTIDLDPQTPLPERDPQP
jgi:hypothetical protein